MAWYERTKDAALVFTTGLALFFLFAAHVHSTKLDELGVDAFDTFEPTAVESFWMVLAVFLLLNGTVWFGYVLGDKAYKFVYPRLPEVSS